MTSDKVGRRFTATVIVHRATVIVHRGSRRASLIAS